MYSHKQEADYSLLYTAGARYLFHAASSAETAELQVLVAVQYEPRVESHRLQPAFCTDSYMQSHASVSLSTNSLS